MAAFEFKLPDIGEGVTEGEVVEWHVKPGDAVVEDQPMVEVMTDKATVTIGAPKKGVIAELKYAVGAIAKVGSVLVVIDTEGTAGAYRAPSPPPAPAAPPSASKRDDGPAATAVGDIREGLPGSAFFQSRSGNGSGAVSPTAMTVVPRGDYYEPRPLATPATRKLARDMEIDLRRVRPTGPGGRVTKDDVRGFVSRVDTGVSIAAPTVRPVPSMGGGLAPGFAPTVRAPISVKATPGELEERKPFVGIRRRIAERMQMSKNTAAHFTFVEECDCERLTELRDRLRPAAEARGVKLTFLPFVVKAVVAALKNHPVLNSALDETTNELVYKRYYHVGIAAATEAGLMVPVVRDADQLGLLDIAREIDRLGEGARAGTLGAQELSGSTFTITSLGRQGGLFATPVLNFPEVGILGVHQMKEKPVVKNGQIVIGKVMLLSLSFDHRIVDGHVGAAFAYDIIALLERPEEMFL